MSDIKVQYEVQELVGRSVKRWKSVTHPLEEREARQQYELYKNGNYGKCKFRLVKIETKTAVIEEMQL